MASSQDMAFLRHAVGAGYMSESVALICQRAVDTSLANGRQVTVAELAIELGMIDAGNARRTIDVVRAGEPTLRLAAVLPLPSSGAAPFPPRAGAPLRTPAPAPPETPDEGDIGGRTLMLQAGMVLPLPPTPDDDDVPAPASPSHPDELSDSDLADLASVTLTGDLQTIPLPRNAGGGFDPPVKKPALTRPPEAAAPAAAAAAAAAKAELARAIDEASRSTEAEAQAQVRKAPEPAAATRPAARPAAASGVSARPDAPHKEPKGKGKGSGLLYLGAASALIVGLLAFAATREGDEEGTKSILGVKVATTNTEPAPPRLPPAPVGVVPSPAPPPPPPPLADPGAALAAFEEKVQKLVANGGYAEARALESKLPPDVTAEPSRRARVEAARRSVDEAHRLKIDRERRAMSDLLDDGDVAGARARARAAAAWALDDFPDRLRREVEDSARQRHAPLAALHSAKLVEVETLEKLVRGLLSEGADTTFFPNGGVALEYGQAFAALATDLRVGSPEHPAGVHIDVSQTSSGLLVFHRLTFSQVLDVSIDFQVLRALRDPKAAVALLVGMQSEGEQVAIGTSWDGEPVQLTRSKGLVRLSREPDAPPTPGVVHRLRLEVAPGPNLGITTTATVKDLRDGVQRGGQPMPWPQRRGSRGFVAIYVNRADVAVSALRVRGLADLDAIKQ